MLFFGVRFTRAANSQSARDYTGLDKHVGLQFGTNTVLPQPYWVLLVNMATHYHHDFLYLCTVCGPRSRDAEYEGQWVELSKVPQLLVPDDIKYFVNHFMN